jgi:flagellar hook-associated protein 3 FlgL
MATATMRGLDISLTRAQRLQEQLSSGRSVARPSDDPAASVSAMKLRSQRRADEQYLRNIDDATGRLAVADDALSDLSSYIRRAQDLLVAARDPAIGGDGRTAISVELEAIRKGMIDVYNTRWLDRPVFGGTVTGTVAVDPETGEYIGDEEQVVARISRDVTMRIDVRGTDAAADTLPALIEQAAKDVIDDPDTVAVRQEELATALSAVLKTLGSVGARAAQLETSEASVDSERLDFTSRISEQEDIDLPKTIMELQSAQAAYEAALGAAAKIMQKSLLDFLR